MGEYTDGSTPTPDQLMEWVDTYGLTHPVVADPSFGYSWQFMSGALPSQTLMSAGAVIEVVDQYGLGGSDIEAVLPE